MRPDVCLWAVCVTDRGPGVYERRFASHGKSRAPRLVALVCERVGPRRIGFGLHPYSSATPRLCGNGVCNIVAACDIMSAPPKLLFVAGPAAPSGRNQYGPVARTCLRVSEFLIVQTLQLLRFCCLPTRQRQRARPEGPSAASVCLEWAPSARAVPPESQGFYQRAHTPSWRVDAWTTRAAIPESGALAAFNSVSVYRKHIRIQPHL